MHQTTLKKSIECSGIGLHSGEKVRLVLRPAPADTGIEFCITSASGVYCIAPNPENVMATSLATTLGKPGSEGAVATVEHLMAAIRGMGVDNLRIDVHGGELPIMDGSAASFVFLIHSAGLRKQSAPRRVYMLKKPVSFEEDGKRIEAEPYAGFAVDYTIDFDHPFIGRQTYSLEITPESFITHIAKARTFGFLRDVEMLQRHGMARGGSLDNAVVLDEYSVVNPEGLRFEDEFVRHKILDFIGDTGLMDLPLQGRFKVERSGHAVNNGFMRVLSHNRDLYLKEATLPLPAAVPEPEVVSAGAGSPVHV